MNASEALYGFCGWLTTRDEKTVMSSTDDAAPIPDLIDQFCKANDLPNVGEDWHMNLIHPTGECSNGTTDSGKDGQDVS